MQIVIPQNLTWTAPFKNKMTLREAHAACSLIGARLPTVKEAQDRAPSRSDLNDFFWVLRPTTSLDPRDRNMVMKPVWNPRERRFAAAPETFKGLVSCVRGG